MKKVDEYISRTEGLGKQWLFDIVAFFREQYPEVQEDFINKMPTYRFADQYIAFKAMKRYFSVYISDDRMIDLLLQLIPYAQLTSGYVKIKYVENFYFSELFDVFTEMINFHNAQKNHGITELGAARKWAKIQPQYQKLLLSNVFCSPCGVTTVVDYTLKDDRFGFVIIGKCQKCGKDVARYVEGND